MSSFVSDKHTVDPLAKLFVCVGLLAVFPLLGCDSADKPHWTSLFDGQSLEGWVKQGGDAEFKVQDGAIVGIAVASSSNTFLCTENEYGDFELQFEFLPDESLNSGVQIRSHCFPDAVQYTTEDTAEDTADERTITVDAGRVHGYQVELENEDRDRGWFGGIYDEGRRGWLFPSDDSPEKHADFGKAGYRLWKRGDWNEVRVRCEGDRIQTWINGVGRADFLDDMSHQGFIGLQVHSVEPEHAGAEVKWRNLRIRELGDGGASN